VVVVASVVLVVVVDGPALVPFAEAHADSNNSATPAAVRLIAPRLRRVPT
jgi:hypothetical protein